METKEEKIEKWSKLKNQLNKNYENDPEFFKALSINKGDIYMCEIGENIGEEQSLKRPVLVLSKTFYNNVSTQITIAPLSTTVKTKIDKHGKKVPLTRTHFILKKEKFSFLDADSCVKCEQIRSISKARLLFKMGNIGDNILNKINLRVKDLFDI